MEWIMGARAPEISADVEGRKGKAEPPKAVRSAQLSSVISRYLHRMAHSGALLIAPSS